MLPHNHDGAATVWNTSNPTSAFEYMPNATFSTFNTFAGSTSQYVKDSDAQDGANFGFRYKDSTEGGTNFSLNFFRHDDANPYIDMESFEDVGFTTASIVQLCKNQAIPLHIVWNEF